MFEGPLSRARVLGSRLIKCTPARSNLFPASRQHILRDHLLLSGQYLKKLRPPRGIVSQDNAGRSSPYTTLVTLYLSLLTCRRITPQPPGAFGSESSGDCLAAGIRCHRSLLSRNLNREFLPNFQARHLARLGQAIQLSEGASLRTTMLLRLRSIVLLMRTGQPLAASIPHQIQGTLSFPPFV